MGTFRLQKSEKRTIHLINPLRRRVIGQKIVPIIIRTINISPLKLVNSTNVTHLRVLLRCLATKKKQNTDKAYKMMNKIFDIKYYELDFFVKINEVFGVGRGNNF